MSFYRPKRSFGQGNIFTPVCHSVHRGGVCSKFWGGEGGRGGGGVCSKFLGGGVSAPNFRGGVCSKFSGGVCSKFSGGGVPPIFGIRSPFGRYASYWNAFFLIHKMNSITKITCPKFPPRQNKIFYLDQETALYWLIDARWVREMGSQNWTLNIQGEKKIQTSRECVRRVYLCVALEIKIQQKIIKRCVTCWFVTLRHF